MIKLVHQLIKQSHIVFLTLIFFVVAGVASYLLIPKMENPNTNLPAASITTIYPGASSLQVEAEVTKIIESKIASIQQVDTIQSYSYANMSVVIVLFELAADASVVLPQLNAALDALSSQLPSLAQPPIIKTDLTDVPAFILALSSDIETLDGLERKADELIKQLSTIDGMIKLEKSGTSQQQVDIIVDLEKIAFFNLSLEQISQLLLAQHLRLPAGFIQQNQQLISVNLDTALTSLSDIEAIIIGLSPSNQPITIADVATVSISKQAQTMMIHQGKEAILISGFIDSSKNWIMVGKEVEQELNQFQSTLSWRYHLEPIVFAPHDISQSVNGFIINLFFSIALIVLVVMFAVRIQNALVVSLSLPLSILSTFIIMYLYNIEFHFISIAALIISLGILVDNGIVVSEGIQANLNEDQERLEAILNAVKTNAKPVFTSTLTTMVTFGILFFIPGTIGKTVSTIPFVVIVTLLASYIVAMFIIPVFAYHFLVKEKITRVKKYRKTFLKSGFALLLDIALVRPKRALLVAISFLLLSLLLFYDLGLSFFPNSDKPMVYVNIISEGNQLETTHAKVQDVINIVNDFEEVSKVSAAVGSVLPKFFITVPIMNSQPSIAQVLVQLDPDQRKFKSNEDFGFALQNKLDQLLVGAKAEVKYLEYSLPTQAKLVFNIKGEDLLELKATADLIEDLLNKQPGAYHIRDSYLPNVLEATIQLDQDRLNAFGFLKIDVARQVNAALMGISVADLTIDDKNLQMVVSSTVDSIEDLNRLLIVASNGNAAYLSQIATIAITPTQPTLVRQNQQRTITVLADVYPGYVSARIELAVLDALKSENISDDITISTNGEFKNLMDLVSNLGVLAVVAIAMIYFILLLQFKTFKKPWIILATIPFSLTGVFIGLYLLQVDVQAMALLGLVSLIGVVVNNGILLVDQIERKLEEGVALVLAIKQSVDLRYRPIMLTTITTVIGLIPLILSNDPMTAPMALVLFFGLSSATLLTLVVVPVLAMLWMGE